jgi:hypothetical protein
MWNEAPTSTPTLDVPSRPPASCFVRTLLSRIAQVVATLRQAFTSHAS